MAPGSQFLKHMNSFRDPLFGLVTLALSFVISQTAQAQTSCERLFEDDTYREFVQPKPSEFPGTLKRAASMMMLLKLRRSLPAGDYNVVVNGWRREIMMVKYDENGDVEIRFASRPLVQTVPVALTRSVGPIAKNMSYGISTRVQHVGSLIISNSVVRGNENLLAGLERRDISLDFGSIDKGEKIQTITITENSALWSRVTMTGRKTEPKQTVEIVGSRR